MRAVRFALFTFLAACSTSTAWAQYGLYGSPETLSVPQQQAHPALRGADQLPDYHRAAGPAGVDPGVLSGAAPAYYPAQPPAYYPAQPPYRYPAQPPAMYQPYQPAAQYRYQYPVRPPVRTAAIEPTPTQPMPMPPAVPAATGVAVPPAAPAPQGSGMMNQMLAEQGCAGCYGGDCGYGNGAYRGAVGRYEQSACGPAPRATATTALAARATTAARGTPPSPRWSWAAATPAACGPAAVDGHPEIQLANTQINMPWEWGGEVRVGHRFCCGCTPYALEGTFWTTAAMSGCQTTTCPGGYDGLVSTTMPTDNVYFDLPG